MTAAITNAHVTPWRPRHTWPKIRINPVSEARRNVVLTVEDIRKLPSLGYFPIEKASVGVLPCQGRRNVKLAFHRVDSALGRGFADRRPRIERQRSHPPRQRPPVAWIRRPEQSHTERADGRGEMADPRVVPEIEICDAEKRGDLGHVETDRNFESRRSPGA